MKIFTIDDVVLHCSEDEIRETEEFTKDNFDPRIHIDLCLDSFLKKNSKIEELARLYSELNSLKGISILSAHGDYNFIGKKWIYFDDKKQYSVQRWINKYDGKFGVIILQCCNPEHVGINSKKSAIINYNNIYSGLRQAQCDGQVEIYIPKIGYVGSYIIDKEIEKMRELVK